MADPIDILNVNPEITFFKSVFKRHTDFTLDDYVQITTAEFGKTIRKTIDKSGDLLTDIYLEFKLPKVSGNIITGNHTYAHWVSGVGYAIINEVTLTVDNYVIDKHTGLWYDIWNELTDVNKTQWSLVGKYDHPKLNYKEINETRYYVPLQFYFSKNHGLSLPLFLLESATIKLEIKLNKLRNLIHFDSGTYNENNTISEFKINTIQISLSEPERQLMREKNGLEYVIETLSIKNNVTASELNNLNFSGSVKEIIWVFRHNDRIVNASDSTTNKINLPGSTSDNTYPNDIFNYSKINKNGTEKTSGTAQSGGSATITLSANESTTDDYYTNYYITITSGTGSSKNKTITDYNGTTKVATVNNNWTTVPDNTSVYTINEVFTFDNFTNLQIQIDNQDMVRKRDSVYFRTYLPYKHHSKIPGGKEQNEKSKYIYMYSFSLNPEEFQPSGHYNFDTKNSKIKFIFNNKDLDNYELTIFSLKYQYLSVTNGSLNIESLPTVSTYYNDDFFNLEDDDDAVK